MRTAWRASLVFWSAAWLAALAAPAVSDGPDLRSRLEKRVFTSAQGESLPYRLFVPAKYDPKQKYPLILFLHGAGERGSDNESQLKHAQVLRFVSDEVQAKHPCFLVAPQCPGPAKGKESRWAEVYWGLEKPHKTPQVSKPLQLTMELLDALARQYTIDPDRRYVTGLSMGGYGSFDLCVRRPREFAAAVPVCGGADDSQAMLMAPTAFWVIHGGADPVVPVGRSRSIVAALKAAGANPRYTEYPGVGHNAWVKAYNEPELVEWLFAQKRQSPRPPAVPLVVHDPYFSIWSFSDHLAEGWPRHWTGATHALTSTVRIDGKPYRIMGLEPKGPTMRQVGLTVLPTRTIYEFEQSGVRVRLTFTSPLLPHDLDTVGRPVSYLTWEARSIDGRQHQVAVYYDNSAELVVDKPQQAVVWSRPAAPGLVALSMGSKEQPVLEKSGDNLRIDWGCLYVAAPAGNGVSAVVAGHRDARNAFAAEGRLPGADDSRMPRPANDDWPVTALAFDLGKVGREPVSRWLMLAYDDVYSIELLGTRLRPWWRRNGMDATGLLQTAAKQYRLLSDRCEAFDQELMADLTLVGGPGYANLCALTYRQAIGAHKLAAGPKGEPMLFPKECFSNGCISTVDVIYPAAPIFMLLDNDLLKATLTPILHYAATDRWKFPFAPHDLGTYPKANGQVYGGGERTEQNQMPVEESGNLLIVAAVVSRLDGNVSYAKKYWPQLERWAGFLKQKGLDPENQLCTDDFAGHLAHNANLSLKAILALGAYAQMCRTAGLADQAAEYRRTAEAFARQWVKLADDGDHFRLAFDRPGTWSQKYNLAWDKLLGLNLFPPEVARQEVAFYKTRLNRFGLPLDNRALYTKTDWEVWTATLADNRADFDCLMQPVYAFVEHTLPRVPLTDWYMTDNAKRRGFQARPVIGGVFIKMLDDPTIWKKWPDRAAKAPPP